MDEWFLNNFAQEVTESVLKFYKTLPKNGKPEYPKSTTIAAIIATRNYKNIEILALGTGTKCLGINKYSKCGNILNDTHAEIMTRRSFKKYILYEAESCINKTTENNIFKIDENGLLAIDPNIEFHLFITQSPCGDASIIQPIIENKSKMQYKNIKMTTIGAKIIKYKNLNKFEKEVHVDDVQEIGHVRRKPGKGFPTPCVSCSDKINKWCYLGIQGCDLMDILSKPIYLKSLIICSDSLIKNEIKIAAEKTFKRDCEILKDKIKGNFKFQPPIILTANLPLNNDDLNIQNTLEKNNLATTSINWTKYKNKYCNFEKSEIIGNCKWIKNGIFEVIVGNTGLKLGANIDLVVMLKNKDLMKLRSRLCRNEIKKDVEFIRNKLNIDKSDELSLYQMNWHVLKYNSFFNGWIDV